MLDISLSQVLNILSTNNLTYRYVTLVDVARNPHAVALGQLGGKARAENLTAEKLSEIGQKGGIIGGKARAEALTAQRRSDIARQAALARWAAKKEGSRPTKRRKA